MPLRSLTTVALLLAAAPAGAETAAEILKKVDAAGQSKTARMEEIQLVVTPSGDERRFEMVSYNADGTSKSLMEYRSPNRVRGMKILTLNDGDDIWTWFPRTNRTRKIASSARNRRVQGSDFTYDDMASGKMARSWRGNVRGSEKLDGTDCHVLALTPTPQGPQSYSKVVVWVRKADYAVLRIDYTDLDGVLQKRLEIGDYRRVGGVLVPYRLKMTNLTDGGRTLMKVTRAEVDVKLPADLFAEASLGK